jgi:hypothetical protein
MSADWSQPERPAVRANDAGRDAHSGIGGGGTRIRRFATPLLLGIGLTTLVASREVVASSPPAHSHGGHGTKAAGPADVVVHVSDLPRNALSEFGYWKDPASPGGRLIGTPQTGGELDPPPENDPHVTMDVPVQAGTPYRCWIHMKVGKAKGKSQANLVFVQFTNAVDKANKFILRPKTNSYLIARGPLREGWAWVPCEVKDSKSNGSLVQFNTGEATIRIQAGMEGVGFDQVVLSPDRYLEKAPSAAIVTK